MNKLVTVLGVAAVATLAGCKDPNYKPMGASQSEVKVVEPAPTCTCAPGTKHTEACACGASDCKCVIEIKPEAPSCKCAPGTKHMSPCTCGASDCTCVVEVKSAPAAPAAEPAETTTYVVQPGDYLAKISKKYNVTISSIKRLNNLKSDTIRAGQKLQLPGKLTIVQDPAATSPKAATGKPVSAAAYKGPTKDYIVKSGDTLGAIAYGNGCNIRQLKALNGLKSDSLKVGQKLKVPADGKAAASAKAAPAEKKAVPAPEKAETAPEATAPTAAAPAAPEETKAEAPSADATAPAAEAAAEPATQTYVVAESDDMTGVSIRFCVSAAAIRELNNLPEDAQLTVGQVIKLPADAQQ